MILIDYQTMEYAEYNERHNATIAEFNEWVKQGRRTLAGLPMRFVSKEEWDATSKRIAEENAAEDRE